MTSHPRYVTTSTIARFAGMDRRTVARRLSCAGQAPDATLLEADGTETALWRKERLLDLVSAVGRIASIEAFQNQTMNTADTITSAPTERPDNVFSGPATPIIATK